MDGNILVGKINLFTLRYYYVASTGGISCWPGAVIINPYNNSHDENHLDSAGWNIIMNGSCFGPIELD
jgi:hypothetical protein